MTAEVRPPVSRPTGHRRSAPAQADPGDARSQGYVGGIEGLRALAAVLVVVVHSAFVSGLTPHPGAAGAYTARAEVGVGVFFLISGFLLYRPFAAAHLAGAPRPATVPYLIRRALRIIPLYWVALAVTLALTPAARPRDGAGWLLLPGFGQVYRDRDVFLGLPQAWSLDVEILFYLALPLWALLVGRLARLARSPLRAELTALAGLYAVGLGARWALELTNPVPWKVWHGFLPVWFDLFALGMALGVLSAHWRRIGGSPAWLDRPGIAELSWLAAGGGYVVLATGIGLGRAPLYDRHPGQAIAEEVLWGLIGVLLLLPAVAGHGGPVRWLLRWRPVAFVGLVSYGVYLWHQLVIDQLVRHGVWHVFRVPFGAALPTVLGITVAAAAVTYLLVERPGVAVGRRLARQAQPGANRPDPNQPDATQADATQSGSAQT